MNKDLFNNKSLGPCYSSIGQDISSQWANCEEHKGYLRIYSGLSPIQSNSINAIGRNIDTVHISASTGIELGPSILDTQAGLIAYLDKHNWHFFYQTSNNLVDSKVLQISSCVGGVLNKTEMEPIDISDANNVQLKISIEENKILFYYSVVKYQWHKVGASLKINSNQTKVKETEGKGNINLGFIGMCVQDSTESGSFADFEYFKFEDHTNLD